MEDHVIGQALFGLFYQGVELTHAVRDGRIDPDWAKSRIEDAVNRARTFVPSQYLDGVHFGATLYYSAIRDGLGPPASLPKAP